MFRKGFINLLSSQKLARTTYCFINSYESNINLRYIYPQSSLNICKITHVPESEDGGFTGFIPLEELTISYSRSGAPGGQHVNKVNTKVDIRFHLESAKWLSDDVKSKVSEKYYSCLNAEGFFIVRSERTRSQQLNVADALDKLRFMINTSMKTVPPPSYKDIEMQRRRQEKATRERLRQKRSHSLIKRDRRDVDSE